jgi:hypothetical protein
VELGLGDEVYAGPVGCGERTADGCGVDVLERCTEACAAHGSFTEGEEEVERGIHGPLFAQESDPDVEGPMSTEPGMDGSCRHRAKVRVPERHLNERISGKRKRAARSRGSAIRGLSYWTS